MCILSKSGVSTETAIVVFPDSLIYINELIDHDKGGDRKAPCMCFSFNGKVKSSKVTTSEDFDDILKLHQETEIYYTLGTDSADFVQITESGGYEIYTGPREQVYEKALENYPESEKFLKPLIDDEITHGENAVYAVPVNAKNDWTAIQINFEKNLRPEEIIFPLCHEISGYNKYYFTI